MKQTVVFGVGIVALFCAGAACAQAPDLEQMDVVLAAIPDGPVAFVNGEGIGADDFRDFYMGEATRWAQLNGLTNLSDGMRIRVALNSLRLLIEREILLQEARKRKLSISDAELEKRWEDELAMMKRGLSRARQGEGGEEPSEEEVLKLADSSREEALTELRKALLIERMRDAVVKEKNVSVSDKEVKDFFEANPELTRRPDSYHVKQIYVRAGKVGDDAKEKRAAAREKVENALKRIRAGESFDKVAKDVCEGRLKATAGDMGVTPVADMPDFILKAVDKMEPGQMSDVFESEFGVHLVKLVEFVPGKEPSLEGEEERIRRLLLSRKTNEATRQFCGEVTNDDSIQVFLDIEKQIVTRPELFKAFADSMEPTGDDTENPQ